jgi:hypothetical protein
MPLHGTTPDAKHARQWSDERVRAPARVDHKGRRHNGMCVCGGRGELFCGRESLPCRCAAPHRMQIVGVETETSSATERRATTVSAWVHVHRNNFRERADLRG